MKRVSVFLAAMMIAISLFLIVWSQTAVAAAPTTNEGFVPIESVEIVGPVTGTIGTTYQYTAVVYPPTTTQPINYDWFYLDSFGQWIHININSNVITHSWPEAGTYILLVNAGNAMGYTSTYIVIEVFSAAPTAVNIYTNRNMTSPFKDGLLNTSHQAIFGPHICTDYGDPYSPLNSTFRPPNYPPGPYTYRYRIFIPYDYPDDIVRVELFDPDSINAAANDATVVRTGYAIGQGLPVTSPRNCTSHAVGGGSNDRRNPCLLRTGEETLVTPTVTIDDINLYWFMRVDENRGAGTPPGNGSCGMPSSYSPNFNTPTLFELYYYSSVAINGQQRVDLASYTGQTGLEANNHDTDLRWVSPGGPLSYDQFVFVPADPGSPKSFQINLSQDVPNMEVDPETGGRYLYLDVTALDGASENGFEIWAGPDYSSITPSHVNFRNLDILNTPGIHQSRGVEVFAMDYLPQNSNTNSRVDIPLIEIGPEYAGEIVYVSLFDADSGAAVPLNFSFDTISPTDWEYSFPHHSQPQPDGITNRNCSPGSCNNIFITPAYAIQVPGDLDNCDWQNPDPADCTPFYGGRLIASYDGGSGDTYGWEVEVTQPVNPDPTVGCSAFPIALHEGIRSVTPPGTGSNPYPQPSDFDYPLAPPDYYTEFPLNDPDRPLANAKEGYVYKIPNGFGPGQFGFLVWNEGISANANTLVQSLVWPGNTLDYSDHGDGGTVLPGFDWVVRGYVNPFDSTDTVLQIDDWVAASTGSINSTAVQAELQSHIDTEQRTLRLLVWDESSMAGSGMYKTAAFAIFRLHGYNLSSEWLLLEFVGWDTSCGQEDTPPHSVTIAGPNSGDLQSSYTFTATVAPVTAGQPVLYTWTATGQAPITHTGGLTDVVSYTWPPLEGMPTAVITVTADNGLGVVTATHTLNLSSVPLAGVEIVGPTTNGGLFTAVVTPTNATLPISYTWQADAQLIVTGTGGITDTAVFHWPIPYTYTILVTTTNGFSTVTDTHQVVIPPAPPVPGCASFPIALHEGARSVTPPGTGSNPYPQSSLFDYPDPPPIYENFFHHVDDVLLQDAQEGTIYKLNNGFGEGQFGWLVWNEGIAPNANTLAGSLAIPGDSNDYTNHGDGGQPVAPYPWVVRGYVNPFDNTDLILQIGDWVPASTGSVNANVVRNQIENHISSRRALRLLVWGNAMGSGNDLLYQTSAFAYFRLHGYHIGQGADGSWLMLEFIGWDDTVCTEGQFPVADVTIAGPLTGTVDMDYDFTATVVPTQTTQPITYTWQATDQTALLQTAALTDTITYNWDTSGTKLITVTAANSYNMVTAVHTITVHTPVDFAVGRPTLITPLPVMAHTPVSFTIPITNLGTMAADGLFFVDLFIDPDIVLTTTIPLSQSVGYVALADLSGGASQVVTITAVAGFANTPQPHLVYAMVDTSDQFAEPDETNNVSPPLVVTDVIVIEPLTAVTLTGAITGEVGVAYVFTAVAVPISATQPITYIWEASGHAPITQTNGLTDTVAFSWAVTGTQTITVTAMNEAGEMVTAVHTITISAPPNLPQHILYLPFAAAAKP